MVLGNVAEAKGFIMTVVEKLMTLKK